MNRGTQSVLPLSEGLDLLERENELARLNQCLDRVWGESEGKAVFVGG
jgi:hypothetical protein